jgi:hypothetical protein
MSVRCADGQEAGRMPFAHAMRDIRGCSRSVERTVYLVLLHDNNKEKWAAGGIGVIARAPANNDCKRD